MSKNDIFIFDTHCHLADEKYHCSDVDLIIKETNKMGIALLNVGWDKVSNEKVVKQTKEFPSLIVSLGIHPNSDSDLNQDNLDWIEKQLSNKKVKAVGEIGLDYYHNFTKPEKQKEWLKKQLILAKKHNLPVLLHIREAFDDAYEIVKELKINKGVIHCFTGSLEIAEKFISLGFFISLAGNITYQNPKWEKKIKEVLENIPLDKILIETDSPYLTPQKLRGEINYPKNIIHTLEKIVSFRREKKEDVIKIIYKNSLNFLNL